jgi:bacterioferritin-associated ferredoxin
MKPQDRKIKKLVEEIGHDVGQFLQAVGALGNQCAWTDRMVEQIINDAEELKKTYEGQFKEK